MRKILFALTILFSYSGSVFSQACNIQAVDTGLISPPIDSIPCIIRGLPYTEVAQISLLGQFNGIIQVDSMVITSVSGLPAGISYAPNPSSGVLYGATNGCLAFSGTTNDSAGIYNLTFNGYIVVTSPGAGTQSYSLSQIAQLEGAPVPAYSFEVINGGDSCRPQVISALSSNNMYASAGWSIYPNPNAGIFNVVSGWEGEENINLVLSDISGRIVYSQKQPTVPGSLQVDISSFSRGVYFVQIQSTKGLYTKKIIVQ
jgi:hypothetical protein